MLSIDIVVPTYTRPDDIKKFVDEILSQSYDKFNVFIIDDHGEADLSWLLNYNSKIHYTRLSKNQGQASARNIGIKKGVGDIVVSLDDDAWFYKDIEALKKVANYFILNI